MHTRHKTGTVATRSPRRTLGQDAIESDLNVVPERDTAAALQRPAAESPSPHSPQTILGLQHTIGNRAVQRLLMPDLQRQPEEAIGVQPLAKILGQEDELPLAKVVRATPVPAMEAVRRVAVETQVTGSSRNQVGTTAGEVVVADLQVGDALAKAVLAVQSGAAASHALTDTMYGLTFPERVDVEIGASLDAGAKTWKPVVKKLTGNYSQQIRLLPGQSEITGPGGNTTKTSYCSQCINLAALGNVTGNKWYVIAAVVAHENVHATRFKPGLVDVEAEITKTIEAVTVPHTGSMTEAEAVKQLESAAAYQAAVKKAYQLWLLRCAALVSKDHDGGGPTDKAEETVTKPLLTSICAHAKKEKWPACAVCTA